MTSLARTLVLSFGLGTAALVAAPTDAAACGGYQQVSDADRVQAALTAFLGPLGARVAVGPPRITADRARVMIEYDADAGGGRRARARQTYVLARRAGGWQVVDWSFPVRAPAAKVARRV